MQCRAYGSHEVLNQNPFDCCANPTSTCEYAHSLEELKLPNSGTKWPKNPSAVDIWSEGHPLPDLENGLRVLSYWMMAKNPQDNPEWSTQLLSHMSLIEKNDDDGDWEISYVPENCVVQGKPRMGWHIHMCQGDPEDLDTEARLLCHGIGWSAGSRMEREQDDAALECFNCPTYGSSTFMGELPILIMDLEHPVTYKQEAESQHVSVYLGSLSRKSASQYSQFQGIAQNCRSVRLEEGCFVRV